MAAFVLAHLSDPHLGPLPRPRAAELIGKRALGFINWHRGRHAVHRADILARIVADMRAQTPDHVAVTGDLINIGLTGEYGPAFRWLEALGAPRDVTLVPGNHDAYMRATADHADEHWGGYMRGDAGEGFPFVRRRGDVALIGLSTAIPTGPFIATGLLGAEQLHALGDVLDACADLYRIVLIHHPPRKRRHARHKRLVDAAAFHDVLAQHGAELVIHGHDHIRSLEYLAGPAGPVPLVGVPSASAAPGHRDHPAGYNLYRIADGRCEMIARGLAADGETVTEMERRML